MELADSAINSKVIENAMNYDDYRDLIHELLEEGKTTGENHSDEMINYTRLNINRMKRLDNRSSIRPSLREKIEDINDELIWFTLTEAWCGDAAQNIPVLKKMADLNKNIDLRLILRDEHPEVMDQFLTDGGKSIPKMIVIRKSDETVIGEWGPRPEPVQKMIRDYKKSPHVPYKQLAEQVQKWYNKDKNNTIQDEFEVLIETWKQRI